MLLDDGNRVIIPQGNFKIFSLWFSHEDKRKIKIKHVLLAVAQSRSLHVVHEAYFRESCFRDAIYQHFNFMIKEG